MEPLLKSSLHVRLKQKERLFVYLHLLLKRYKVKGFDENITKRHLIKGALNAVRDRVYPNYLYYDTETISSVSSTSK